MKDKSRFVLPAIFVGLILLGTVLRLIESSVVAENISFVKSQSSPPGYTETELRMVEQKVLDFYRWLEASEFDRAAAEVAELDWMWDAEGKPQVKGIRDQTAFIADSRLVRELGADAFSVVIYKMEARAVEVSRDPVPLELVALWKLEPESVLSDTLAVDVWGTVRVGCTVSEWERGIVAVKMSDGWKLLPPPSPFSDSRMLTWFSKRRSSDAINSASISPEQIEAVPNIFTGTGDETLDVWFDKGTWIGSVKPYEGSSLRMMLRDEKGEILQNILERDGSFSDTVLISIEVERDAPYRLSIVADEDWRIEIAGCNCPGNVGGY